MADKKIIAVVGATGAQGGGLVRAILADRNGEFRVRALTRNPDSDKARALAAAGAELVRADLDDQASLERAFAGASRDGPVGSQHLLHHLPQPANPYGGTRARCR